MTKTLATSAFYKKDKNLSTFFVQFLGTKCFYKSIERSIKSIPYEELKKGEL